MSKKGAAWILILLALFFSYNLDLECLLSSNTGCQTVCQESVEDLCAEPSFTLMALVAILPRSFDFLWHHQTPRWTAHVSTDDGKLPRDPRLRVPIGLRAPPRLAS